MARKRIDAVEQIAGWFQTAPLEAAEVLLKVASAIVKGRRGPEVSVKPKKRPERAFKAAGDVPASGEESTAGFWESRHDAA